MKDKLELQKQYIEVKNKYDELSEKYWSLSEDISLTSLYSELLPDTSTHYTVNEYFDFDFNISRAVTQEQEDYIKNKQREAKELLLKMYRQDIKEQFLLLKELTKQIYYEG